MEEQEKPEPAKIGGTDRPEGADRGDGARSQIGAEIYRCLAETAHDWDYLLDPEGAFLFVSAACERISGYRPEEFLADPGLLLRLIHPDDRIRFEQHLDRIHDVNKRLEVADLELRIVARDGSERWISHWCAPAFGTDGRYLGRVASNQDISRRKASEKSLLRQNGELLAYVECMRAILRAESERKLAADVCRALCNVAGYRMAWVGVCEQDEACTVRAMAWSGIEDGYLAAASISWADNERGGGPTGVAIRSGRTSVNNDFASEERTLPWRERAFQRGYRSSIALPLLDAEGIAFGALTIYAGEASAFSPRVAGPLETLASDLAFAICALRTDRT